MPDVHHGISDSSASRSATPPSAGPNNRPRIKPADLCVGCIVWLPQKDGQNGSILCSRENCCGGDELEDRGYNHPVVVLRIQQRSGSRTCGDLTCSVAPVSTNYHPYRV